MYVAVAIAEAVAVAIAVLKLGTLSCAVLQPTCNFSRVQGPLKFSWICPESVTHENLWGRATSTTCNMDPEPSSEALKQKSGQTFVFLI